jgi:hypothetical protein
MHILFSLAGIFISLGIGIALFYTVAQLNEGKTPKGNEIDLAKKRLLPYIWVGILVLVITIGPLAVLSILLIAIVVLLINPLFGGEADFLLQVMQTAQDNITVLIGGGVVMALLFLLSWIWMIYKSVQYSQAIPALLLNDCSGYSALTESARIIKHRWWGMLWKNQLWGMVVGLASLFLMMMVGLFLAIPVILIQSTTAAEPLSEFFNQLLNGSIQMLLTPLALIFVIKLYQAFRKTAD